MPVKFFTEDILFKVPEQRKTARWIKKIIEQHNYQTGELNYILSNDNYLLKINQQYLNHDFYTDIITFDLSEEGTNLASGDIYISLERIKDNAHSLQEPFERELKRVFIHGALHLLGYKDHSPEEKEEMRKKEEACLSLYFE